MSDYMDDTFDLGRLRKLAGVPGSLDDSGLPPVDAPSITMDEPVSAPVDLGDPMMNASDDFGPDLGADLDTDIGADLDGDVAHDQYSLDDSPLPVLPSPIDVAQDAMSPWEQSLADLEAKLNDIPVGDFKAVIDSLNRVATHAENIRTALVTEGKRTFLDYLNEAEEGETTLGMNQNDAIKALHARMGGKPQDANAARDKFNELRKSGVIKPKGSSFTMPTMDDDTFRDTITSPSIP